MTCTSVMPCLISGLAKDNKIMSLAKDNKIMSIFVLLSWLSWPFLKFGLFFPKMGGQILHQRSQT